MTRDEENVAPAGVTRRGAIAGACLAAAARGGAPAVASAQPPAAFVKENEAHGMTAIAGIHHGKGIGRARIFAFDGAAAPANFIVYEFPPGASEGVHTHYPDDRNGEGAFDEYYYVVSGRGQMEIDGAIVAVAAGDHVHTPLSVAHGIENTHATETLRVFLTFIQRGDPGRGRA